MTPEAAFDEGVEAAARLLAGSRFPLIAGQMADVDSVVAALRLAERLGGAFDHAASGSLLADLAVLQDSGLMTVTAGEARARADMFLLIGDGPLAAWPDLADFFLAAEAGKARSAPPRQILALTPRPPEVAGAATLTWSEHPREGVIDALAALRAHVNGRPVAGTVDRAALDRNVVMLRAAAYGVALWSPDEIDALGVEMVTGLVKDLNAETRWSGLSVAADAGAACAAIVCGWRAGFPPRIGFGRGKVEHDTWRFEARRLAESGEADAVVWIAGKTSPPAWLATRPAVLIAEPGILAGIGADAKIPVGLPGQDHDAVFYDRRIGTLVEQRASAPRRTRTVANALDSIGRRLEAA